MSITLNFELNDRDLAHFTAAMDRSKKTAEGKTDQEIVAAAVALLEDAQKVHIPDFIKERLLRLDDMIAMVRDESWALPEADKERVLGALMYFCDPQDVIPDHVEVLGFLDDAVMIRHGLKPLSSLCRRTHSWLRGPATRALWWSAQLAASRRAVMMRREVAKLDAWLDLAMHHESR